MLHHSLGLALRHLRLLLQASEADRLSDRQLLAQFVADRDAAAFTVLVQRYGPLVLAVCRRVLRDTHEAEDACQASFLVLARKAGAIRRRESVGSWLYGVAFRIAVRAKAKRRRCRMMGERPPDAPAPSDVTYQEMRTVLDEELVRLPDRFRAPLLLCYFEGMTQDEAARQLCWSLGTFRRRLDQGRELLRGRLARRGFPLAAALSTALLPGDGRAALPASFIEATGQAAQAFVAGRVFSSSATGLAEEMLRTMTITKLRLAAAVVLTLGLVGTGAGMLIPGAAERHELASAAATELPPTDPPVSSADMTVIDGAMEVPEELPPGGVLRLGTPIDRDRSQAVDCVALSPDGKTIATGSRNGVIRLWDRATGKIVRQSYVHRFKHFLADPATLRKLKNDFGTGTDFLPPSVNQIAFLPDAKLGADGFGVFTLWDLATGNPVSDPVTGALLGFEGTGFVLTPDGKHVATVKHLRAKNDANEDWRFVVYDSTMYKVVREFGGASERMSVAALSSDGKALAATDDAGNVFLWDVTTGKELRKIACEEAGPPCLAFAPDGRTFATAGAGQIVRVWRTDSGDEVFSLKHDGRVIHLAFSRDGKSLAVGGGGKVRLWEVASRKERCRLPWPAGPSDDAPDRDPWESSQFAWAATGAALALGANDGAVLHDLDTGRIRSYALPGHRAPVCRVGFSADGKHLLSWGKDRALREWDLATARELRVCRGEQRSVNCAAFFPDGKTLVAVDGDQTLRLWSTATGKAMQQLEGHPGWVRSVAVSGDGRTIAAGSEDQTIRIWNAMTGELLRHLEGHTEGVYHVAFAPDGKTLASVGAENILRLWDLTTGKELRRIEAQGFCAFSPDGKRLVAARPNGVTTVWDVATWKELREFPNCNVGRGTFTFSPDGKQLVANGYSCDILDLETGKTQRSISMPSLKSVTCVAFSPDGKRLATGSEDCTILVWDLNQTTEP